VDEAARNEFLTANLRLLRWAGRVAARYAPGLDPEDAAQEVAVLAVRRFGGYDPARSFSGWLHYLARRVARYHRLRAARTPPALVYADDPQAVGPLDPRACAGAGDRRAADPAAAAERADTLRAAAPLIAAALAELHPAVRRAVVGRFGLDGSGPRPASHFEPGVSRHTVASRVERGLAVLRGLIAGPAGFDAPEL